MSPEITVLVEQDPPSISYERLWTLEVVMNGLGDGLSTSVKSPYASLCLEKVQPVLAARSTPLFLVPP